MVYFARLATGAIKIGTTVRLPDRIKQHSKNGHVTILGVHDGGRDTEKAVHQRFHHLQLKAKVNGQGRQPEHFRSDPELLTYIAENCRDPDLFDQVHETWGKLKSVRLELPQDIFREFRMTAAEEGLSMAAIARRLVEEYLKRKGGSK